MRSERSADDVTASQVLGQWIQGFESRVVGLVHMNMGNMLEAKDILTPAELAKRLKVDVSWVYEKSRPRGKFTGEPLPVLRVGKYLRFAWPDVVAWMRNGGGK